MAHKVFAVIQVPQVVGRFEEIAKCGILWAHLALIYVTFGTVSQN